MIPAVDGLRRPEEIHYLFSHSPFARWPQLNHPTATHPLQVCLPYGGWCIVSNLGLYRCRICRKAAERWEAWGWQLQQRVLFYKWPEEFQPPLLLWVARLARSRTFRVGLVAVLLLLRVPIGGHLHCRAPGWRPAWHQKDTRMGTLRITRGRLGPSPATPKSKRRPSLQVRFFCFVACNLASPLCVVPLFVTMV